MRVLFFVLALLLAPAARAETLADLAWLKGCWRTQGDGPEITEVWLAPQMPAMMGYSYTVGEGGAQTWEQMRIEMIDGAPAFIAMPNGGPPVRFDLVGYHIGVNIRRRPFGGVSFDNLQHDYPQRVEYVRSGNSLTATISGADGANPITFRYRRISCDRSLRP